MKELKGMKLADITLAQFLDRIDAELALRDVRFTVRLTTTGEQTTYYISRDRRANEMPYPEKPQ